MGRRRSPVDLEPKFICHIVFNSEPCELKVSRDFNAGIAVTEMIGRTNYVALVGGGKQPKFPQTKVIIWDDAKNKSIITLEFRTPVYRVRLSRTRIVVALHSSVHVYSFSSNPQKLSVFETTDNPFGLCCLNATTIVFPGRTPGQVQLVEVATGNVTIIPAHAASLRALDLSRDGQILATASETGTLIRIFSTPSSSLLAELRRGVDHATIFSLAISPSSTLLAVTSDKSTLHIFDLPNASYAPISQQMSRAGSSRSNTSVKSPNSDEDGASHKWGILGKIPLLPRVFSDTYSFSSAPFTIGDEGFGGDCKIAPSARSMMVGIPGGRPAQGVIGWTSDESLLIIGAGRDGRWERFLIGEGTDGKRVCWRDGWRRYLGGS